MSDTGSRVAATSAYQKTAKVKESIDDKVEDLRDSYETTQNPVVWAVRDSVDEVFAESDEAAAITELKRLDPEFSLPAFMEEMEEYMIPKFVEAYLKGDMEVLRQMCSGEVIVITSIVIYAIPISTSTISITISIPIATTGTGGNASNNDSTPNSWCLSR